MLLVKVMIWQLCKDRQFNVILCKIPDHINDLFTNFVCFFLRVCLGINPDNRFGI